MNRGQLERLVVRLYMLTARNQIKKASKANEFKRVKKLATKYSETYLIDSVFVYLAKLEAM